MRITYTDYETREGCWAIIGGRIVPYDDKAIAALAANAMVLATGVQTQPERPSEPIAPKRALV